MQPTRRFYSGMKGQTNNCAIKSVLRSMCVDLLLAVMHTLSSKTPKLRALMLAKYQ